MKVECGRLNNTVASDVLCFVLYFTQTKCCVMHTWWAEMKPCKIDTRFSSMLSALSLLESQCFGYGAWAVENAK